MKQATTSEDVPVSHGRGLSLSAWCVVAAFGTYFCMYAFREPFTAAGYRNVIVWGMGYKTVLVTAQVLGYTFSKFVGIKVVAEVPPQRRVALLLGLIGALVMAIVAFAPAEVAAPEGAGRLGWAGTMLAAAGMGAAYGLFPIGWIVLAAIFLYNLTVETGQFEVVKRSVLALSEDRRIQALLIAFCFGAFVEGATTPVDIQEYWTFTRPVGPKPWRLSAIQSA